MKKPWEIVASALLWLGLALCLGTGAFAEGERPEPHTGTVTSGGYTFTWTADTYLLELVIEGEGGVFPTDQVPWQEWEEYITVVRLIGYGSMDASENTPLGQSFRRMQPEICDGYMWATWRYLWGSNKVLYQYDSNKWNPGWQPPTGLGIDTYELADSVRWATVPPNGNTLILGKSADLRTHGEELGEYQNIQLSPENPYHSLYNGALYSKDGTSLYYATGPDQLRPGLQTIEDYALRMKTGTVALPWGTAVLNGRALAGLGDVTVVLPDTVTLIGQECNSLASQSANTTVTVRFSKNNSAAKSVFTGFSGENGRKLVPDQVSTVERYYPDVDFSGKPSETHTGTVEGDMDVNFIWTVDTQARTLTLEGKAKPGVDMTNSPPYNQLYPSYAPVPWKEWEGSIDKIILLGTVGSFEVHGGSPLDESLLRMKPVILCQWGDGFSWEYRFDTQKVTYSGKGVAKESGWDFHYRIQSVELADGVVWIPWYFTAPLTIWGKDVRPQDESGYFMERDIQISPEHPDLSSYDGAMYNKDGSRLICLRRADVKFHPNLKSIAPHALRLDTENALVLPWGVTTLEEKAITGLSGGPLILPDTITSIHPSNNVPPSMEHGGEHHLIIRYSRNNTEAKAKLTGKENTDRGILTVEVMDSVAQYYPGVDTTKLPQPPSSQPEESSAQPESPASSIPAESSAPDSEPSGQPESSAPSSEPPSSSAPEESAENPESSGEPSEESGPSDEEPGQGEASAPPEDAQPGEPAGQEKTAFSPWPMVLAAAAAAICAAVILIVLRKRKSTDKK